MNAERRLFHSQQVPSLPGPMANGLDVVAVGVEDERAIVVCVIVRPDTRTAVVSSSCLQGRVVERVDLGTVLRHECDMHA